MAYTKRTCHQCGYRDIQPNMVEREISYTSGSSNTGLSGRNVVGAFLGNEKSQKNVGKWMLSPSKRNYKRRKKVWLCNQCAGGGKAGRFIGKIIEWTIYLIGLYFLILWFS